MSIKYPIIHIILVKMRQYHCFPAVLGFAEKVDHISYVESDMLFTKLNCPRTFPEYLDQSTGYYFFDMSLADRADKIPILGPELSTISWLNSTVPRMFEDI